MQGEEVDEVLLGPAGVVGDRAYRFVDVETGRLASANRPKRFGPLLDCHARFLAPPRVDAPAAPVEVTFPDGTVVRGDTIRIERVQTRPGMVAATIETMAAALAAEK